MRHWLLKTEPESFGVEDFLRAPRRSTSWDGVRNYQARNLIRDEMKKGDAAFLYHSSCDVPGIVGILKVTKGAYPDPSAFERRDPHYDPDSVRAKPRWFTVDVRLVRKLHRVISLDELRKYAAKELRGMVLLRPGNRLSVTPVDESQWRFICSLE